MGTPLLAVRGLRVDYDDVIAVNDVSFTVEAGMVYGLIGPNGAGKTSIIKSIATLLDPTWGAIEVGGVDLVHAPLQVVHRIGYMPDFPPPYEDLTVQEFLELFASAYRLSPETRHKRIRDLIDLVQLSGKTDTLAGGLSRGMKQRLFLAKTLLHDPDVLLLDEPASGLDPRARLDFTDIIVELGRQGKAVVVSSHILSEMATFCNSVGIMEEGKMVISGRVDEILAHLRPGQPIAVRLLQPHDGLAPFLTAFEGATAVEVDGAIAHLHLAGEPDAAASLLKALVAQDFPVVDFHREGGDLTDIFLQVSHGRVS